MATMIKKIKPTKGMQQNFKEYVGRYAKTGSYYKFPMQESPKAFLATRSEVLRVFMGIEWEVFWGGQDRQDLIKKIYSDDGHLYLNVHRDAGDAEITTIPATLKAHKKKLNDIFWKDSKSVGYTIQKHQDPSAINIGIHVHVDQRAFTERSIFNCLAFFGNINNRKFCNYIAQREKYAPHVPMVLNEEGKPVKLLLVRSWRNPNSKYCFFNTKTGEEIQYGRNSFFNMGPAESTIEIRMFKSATKKEEMFKNIEFVDAIVRYTRRHSLQKMHWEDFVEWLVSKDSRKKEYENLINFLKLNKDYNKFISKIS